MTTSELQLPWNVEPVLTATVRGLPVPQGSIRSLGKGRPSVHSNKERLLPWRGYVQNELEDQCSGDEFPLSGPVAVELVFTMSKPKSAPKRKRTWPISRPDLDKLERAILDAATNAGVFGDDSQVVRLAADKSFPLEHPAALDVPGVRIQIGRVLGCAPEIVEVLLPEVPDDDGIPW